LDEFALSDADNFSCDLERSSALFLPRLREAVMGKASSILPFALLVTFFGFQSAASAGTITFATGSIELIACNFAGNCSYDNPSIQFQPSANTQQKSQEITGPDNNTGNGDSDVTGGIGFQAPTSSNQSPSSQASAYVTAFPGSQSNELITLGFEFMPVSGSAPPTAPGEVTATGGVYNSSTAGGDVAYASVTITDETTNTTVFSACAVAGSVSSASCAGVTATTFSAAQSINFTPDQIYTLQLEISLAFDNSTAGDHNANASIDPFITNNDPTDFQLALVAPPTPLPPTWTTMLIGLAGLGLVAYRRQKQTSVLAA
jgi:hypothetical protein